MESDGVRQKEGSHLVKNTLYGAHGMDMDVINQRLGAHGLAQGITVPNLVGEAVRAPDQGCYGAAARVPVAKGLNGPATRVDTGDLGLQGGAAGVPNPCHDTSYVNHTPAGDLGLKGPTAKVLDDGTSGDANSTLRPSVETSLAGNALSTRAAAAGPSFAHILRKSSAPQVANNAVNIAPESSKPSIKGNYVCVKINEVALQNRLELCQHSLIGRIHLSKGDTPWKLADLKLKLQSVWGLSSPWRLISLGRGFFHILLPSAADQSKVWGLGSLNLKPGVLRLQPWFPNFNPHTQNSTNAQVWVRFHELPWVYWDRQILSDLARGVGVPIRFDEMTLSGEFGHYARMLIDIDLSQPISDSLMVEVGSDCLFIPLEYERLPSFCSACKFIGHDASTCRRVHKQVPSKDGDKKLERGRSRSRKAIYRPVTKSPKANDTPITTSKNDALGEQTLEKPNQVASPSKVNHTKRRSWAEELEDTEFTSNVVPVPPPLDQGMVTASRGHQ